MADLKSIKLVCIWGHPKDPRLGRARCYECAKKRGHKRTEAKQQARANG